MVMGGHHNRTWRRRPTTRRTFAVGSSAVPSRGGFPEGVEAPGRWTPSRPRGLWPGLTVYLPEGGQYRESPASRAFPGWRVRAVHEALNENEPSGWIHARPERLGRALVERGEGGPGADVQDEGRRRCGRLCP